MTNKETYKFNCHAHYWGSIKLVDLCVANRIAKKICRKCYARLPLDATVCRKCKNPDIRIKKGKGYYKYYCTSDTKNRLFDKRGTIQNK